MLENPCKKDCPDRTGDCHAECPKWLAYEMLRNIQYEESWAKKQQRNDCYQCTYFYRDKKRRRPYADSRYGG